METGLEGKPGVAAGVAVVVAVALVFGAQYFFINKIEKQTEGQDKKLTELKQKIQEGRAAERSLPQFREEVERLQLDLDKLLRILPSQRNTEELLRRIRSLTEQGDFNLMRFTPQAEQPLDFYTEWPIKVELEGTYHNLALFFDRIGRFRRIINVDQLDIAALKNNNRDERSAYTIRARFTAKTFLYNEPFDEEEGE